jgi:hypothetical protein
MKEILSKISNGVKKYQADIILVIGVILISLLSFAAGFIVAKQQEREPLRIEMKNPNVKIQISNQIQNPNDKKIVLDFKLWA